MVEIAGLEGTFVDVLVFEQIVSFQAPDLKQREREKRKLWSESGKNGARK